MKIKENATLIIANNNLRQAQAQVLEANLKGIRILTLHQYLSSFCTPIHQKEIIFEIYHRFKQHLDQFTCFKKSILSYSFIQECLSFLNQLHLYHIQLDELDESTIKNKELKDILQIIYDLPTESTIFLEALDTIDTVDNLYIDIQYPTLEEEIYLSHLYSKGAIRINYPKKQTEFKYYHANNPRCEIESIAQKIIEDHLDIEDVMIACCDTSCFDLYHRILDSYQIPHTIQVSKTSSLSFKTSALLQFSLNPSRTTYEECLNQNCFGHLFELVEVQKYYPYSYDEAYPTFTFDELQTELFSAYEIKQLQSLIQKASLQKEEILPYLNRLIQEDIQDILLCIDEILRTYSSHEDILQIQQLFKQVLPYLHEKEDLKLLIDFLLNLQTSTKDHRWNTLQVLPYSQVNQLNKVTFVIHATQHDFSDFKPLSGIFNEEYVSTIKNYPSLEMRYDYDHKMKMSKLYTGDVVYISYPLSSYLGDNHEPSLDIENLLGHSSLYPLQRARSKKEEINPLDPSISYDLYTKDSILKGSVSSLEKYVGCPYAYFLKYGCKIKEPVEVGFTIQKMGTLNHAILEHLVLKYQKDYTKDEDEMLACIDVHLKDMKIVFPHLNVELMRIRLIENMKLNFIQLSDMEEHSSLIPTHCERKWEKDLKLNNATLHLLGFVDRIDTNETAFRILDYKSSSKKLEKDKVFSGQQLQLCTYTMIMQEDLGLRPLGCFYVSFQNPRFELPYQKLSRRSKVLEEISQEMILNELKKKNRLQGWIFDENVELMDDDGCHILGVSSSKNRGIYARNVYDIKEIKECIEEMMRIIGEDILKGRIECCPNEAACMFCKYHSICRFSNAYTEKPLLVELPQCMKKESKDEIVES